MKLPRTARERRRHVARTVNRWPMIVSRLRIAAEHPYSLSRTSERLDHALAVRDNLKAAGLIAAGWAVWLRGRDVLIRPGRDAPFLPVTDLIAWHRATAPARAERER
jgi:hypothetical protein